VSQPHRIRSIASRLFVEPTMARVIDPILADLQCEYDEALARGGRLQARLGLARSYIGLARAVIWLGVQTLWPAGGPRADVVRTLIVSAVALTVVTLALAMPALVSWPGWQDDPRFSARLALLLLPQALPLSLPAGLCVAVLWGMRGRVATWRRIAMVLSIALACTAAVWVVLEWIMPEANQGFREMVAARLSDGRVVTLERGLSELGLSRLGQRSDPAAVRQYQTLWALCFASAPLSLLALGLARYVRRAVWAVVLATVLCNLYFAVLWTTAAGAAAQTIPAPVAAWAPNTICVLVGCALLRRALRLRPA
jgi:hypothetical protein